MAVRRMGAALALLGLGLLASFCIVCAGTNAAQAEPQRTGFDSVADRALEAGDVERAEPPGPAEEDPGAEVDAPGDAAEAEPEPGCGYGEPVQGYAEPVHGYQPPARGCAPSDGLTREGGVNAFGGRTETWYSSNVLYHVDTPEWSLDGEGFYRDAEGRYVVAASDMEPGTVFEGSKGECVVLDAGCAPGVTDYYVGW